MSPLRYARRVGSHDPLNLPIPLEQFKLHAHIDNSVEDSLLVEYIEAAADTFSAMANVALVENTYRAVYKGFPCLRYLEIPYPPLVSVESIEYLDSAGQTQTLSDSLYTVRTFGLVGLVQLVPDARWPDTYNYNPAAVTINYTAGHQDSASLPRQAKQAMRLFAAHWYANRESVLVGTVSKEIEHSVRLLAAQLWVPDL